MKSAKWIWKLLFIVIGLPVIISVIGVLAGLISPEVTGARHEAEKRHAETTSFGLKNAISAYRAEYRDYPILNPVNDHTLNSDHELMDIVLGSDKQAEHGGRNPRRIAFYNDKRAKPIGESRFRKGLTFDEKDGTGELWDPWGNHYRVRFDSDGNGRVENPDPTAPSDFLPESIIVWSAGPDGDFETWDDNVKTW